MIIPYQLLPGAAYPGNQKADLRLGLRMLVAGNLALRSMLRGLWQLWQ